MPKNPSSNKAINHPISIALTDEGFFDYLNPYNFSNSSNHLKFLFLHLAIFCLIFLQLQTTIESTKSISQSFDRNISQSFSSSINFANDNFYSINHPPLEGGSNGNAVWGGVNFLNALPAFNSNASPEFNNFKNSPSLALNTSSLLFASLQDDSRQPLRRIASLAPEGVLAKNAVRVFLTPEPNNKSTLTAGKNSSNGSIYINSLNIDANTGDISIPSSPAAKDISNNVSIKATNLSAKDDIFLAANKDIRIESGQDTSHQVASFRSKKRGSHSETKTTKNIKTNIEAGGNIVINAGSGSSCPGGMSGGASSCGTQSDGGSLTIKGANVKAAGDAQIIAGKDLNIESVEDSYYHHSESRKKGSFGRGRSHSLTINQITNQKSIIEAGGNLTVGSGNNINIIASDLIAKGNIGGSGGSGGSGGASTGNINLSAVKNINIMSVADTFLREEKTSKQGLTIMKSSVDIKQDLVNVKSNLNAANNINASSGEDINLIGTDLLAGNDLAINAIGELNAYAVADQHYRYQHSTKSRSFATIAKYTGLSLAMKSVSQTLSLAGDMASFGHNKDTRNAAAGASAANNGGGQGQSDGSSFGAGLAVAKGTVGYYQNLLEGDFNSKSTTTTTHDITHQKNQLIAGNNLTLAANNDVNLIGVDLSAINGNITSINGTVSIANVKDSHQANTETHKSKTTLTSFVAAGVRNAFLVASTVVTAFNTLQNPNDKQVTYQENEAAMKDTAQKSQTDISQITDETVIASNLNFANDLNINAGSNAPPSSALAEARATAIPLNRGNIIITSSNLNAGNNININSANGLIIKTDSENDFTFTLHEKKSPNIFATFSNGFVQLFAAAMPDFTPWEAKKDSKEGKAKSQREQDSLDHNAHRIDFETATADKSKAKAMVEGYTISNNDPDEMAYDLDLTKITTRNKINIASNISAQNNINATSNNGDNLIIGSNLSAGGGNAPPSSALAEARATAIPLNRGNINLTSLNGKTIITSAGDESFKATSTVDQNYNDISFSADRGRLAVNSNSKVYEEDTKTTAITQKSSNLLSGGSININAKSDIDILSSNLSSNGNITLTSTNGNTNILANSNSLLTEKEIREATLTLSAGIGHVAVDVAYAQYDLIEAVKEVADAKKSLNHIETLHKQGKADDEALSDAKTNLAVATLNVALADLKLAAAAAKAAESAVLLGFYADLILI